MTKKGPADTASENRRKPVHRQRVAKKSKSRSAEGPIERDLRSNNRYRVALRILGEALKLRGELEPGQAAFQAFVQNLMTKHHGIQEPENMRRESRIARGAKLYAANMIGVPFEVELDVTSISDEKGYLITLFPDNKSIPIYAPRNRFSRTQHSGGHSSATKNACMVEAPSFKTEIEMDLSRDEIIRLTYTPIGTKEDRREREKDLLPKRPQPKKHYRKATELPDPTKSHRAPINRKTQGILLHLKPETLERVDKAARQEGLSRTKWISTHLEELLLNLD